MLDSDWKLLIQLGLPRGAPRETRGDVYSNAQAVRDAVLSLSRSRLDPSDVDVLAAWLSGFKGHFPTAYSEVLGGVGETCLNKLLPNVDPNRYLKLRRIAIENLAQLL